MMRLEDADRLPTLGSMPPYVPNCSDPLDRRCFLNI